MGEYSKSDQIQGSPVTAVENKPKRDTQSRKYCIVINNPIERGSSHNEIKRILAEEFRSVKYYCMADERGLGDDENNESDNNGTMHTHVYVVFNSPVRFSVIKKRFPQAHIETARGNSAQNRDYIMKSGKWESDKKRGTIIDGTFEEFGELPQERQGERSDLAFLYEKVKDGFSNYEILEENPDFMLRLTDIERTRQTIKAEENRDIFRNLTTTYIWGSTGLGKTRSVMEKYGYRNVYRVTDYKHPFDSYKGEDVLIFDEFCGGLPITDMDNYLDGYPLDLPARYANKQACYTRVYIISNIDLRAQYGNIKYNYREIWDAFIRRIHKVINFMPDGTRREYSANECLYGSTEWVELPADTPTPFDSDEVPVNEQILLN